MTAGPVAPNRRLFLGVPLLGAAKESVSAWRLEFPGKKVGAEDAHITLCFLGSVEEARLSAVRAAATRAFVRVPGGAGRLGGCGLFPEQGTPRVLWAGVTEGAETLAQLARRGWDALEKENFSRENRPFVPHVTLARLDAAPPGLKEALLVDGAIPRGAFPIDRVCLYESRPGPNGSRYDILDLWRLEP